MSALARFFMHEGCQVAGYDRTATPLTARLEAEGALVNYEDSVEAAGLPVSISEDGNTVTITGYTFNFEDEQGNVTPVDFYPNVMYESATNGLVFYNSYVTSNVVLTKGWAGTQSVAPKKSSVGNVVAGKRVINATDYKTPAKSYGSTVFTPQTKVQVKQMTAKQPTVEETRKGMEKLVKKLQPNTNK